MSFTILTGKEGNSPKKPLFLVSVTAPDGDTCFLTTGAQQGSANLVYNSTTYLARILNNDLQAIQAMSPQGYDSVPGFSLSIADADKSIWTNHCQPHGWRGASVQLTVILWDVVANGFSTDAIQWTFIGGNPSHDHGKGVTTFEVVSATNFSRLKVPSVPIEYRCPWDFPATAAQRFSALNDPTSPYYQCGYSPDQSGGVGNYASGTTPFTTCEFVRSSPTDPSVGCMARMGNAATTSVAPDGDLTHDKAGHYTGRFGGATFLPVGQYSGRQYTTGQKVFGYNTPNPAIAGAYYNWLYGTQWVPGQVLAPAGDPNSLRSEVAIIFAPFGSATVLQLTVNGVLVPQNNGDVLFTWRYINPGGRNGVLNGDNYYKNASYSGLGDPHGSVCVIEFVVPYELAAPGSVPTVNALVTSGPMLNCYPIAIATASGGEITVTFAAGVADLNIGPGAKCFIAGNSWSSANGPCTIDTATFGPPGVVTLLGTSATGSGTGGGIFFVHAPDLFDSGYSISTQDSVSNAAAANPVWALLDLTAFGNVDLSQIDALSWYNAAQICAASLTYIAADGNSYSHAQFKACLLLSGANRQTLASARIGLKNSANLMDGPNSTTGLIQCFVKQTLADQQPATIAGSNDTTARSSIHADGTSGNGYYAYFFNETNIEKDSFRISTARIADTPNTVAFAFQDEYNSYQQDSLTEVDPDGFTLSGNQEVNVPIPITAVPNFDQATRVANTQLAEALFGNPRNDAGGTEYYEFTINQRVLHLTGRLGYICGLRWQPLGIGVSAPQAVRILSLKPDTDGEKWQVKCAFHNDEWYTYAYGQNPTPFRNNPLLAPPQRPAYPWRPGVAVYGSSDALFPSQDSFDFTVDTSQYPAQLQISGNQPVNAQPSGLPPSVPLQGTTANTGGSIVPGTYLIAFSPNGINGPASSFVTVVVPAGTNTNTITVTGIQWRGGAAPSILPFIGTSSMNVRACGGATYSGSVPDTNGNPTTYTFTAFSPDGVGLPDVNATQFVVKETGIAHGGVWGDAVATVTGGGTVLNFPAGAWSTNQWQNYVLSLYYRPGASPQPALNMTVVSNTATALTMGGSGFLAGDIVVMRTKPSTFSSNTIGDANFVNSYAPSGLTVNGDAGNLIKIIAGKGAGYPPKTIKSNTATVFTVADPGFDVTPDATSVFIVLTPTVAYSYPTNPFSAATGEVAIATTPAITTKIQSLLVIVATADQNGKTAPLRYQPFREVYIPAQSGTVSPGTLKITFTSSPAQLGVPFNTSLAAVGGVLPYTFSISSGSLPGGLSLNASTGFISGTPTASGTFNFTGQVTDAAATTATVSCTITVSAALLPVSSQITAVTAALASGPSLRRIDGSQLTYDTIVVNPTWAGGVSGQQWVAVAVFERRTTGSSPAWYFYNNFQVTVGSSFSFEVLIPAGASVTNARVAVIAGPMVGDPVTALGTSTLPSGWSGAVASGNFTLFLSAPGNGDVGLAVTNLSNAAPTPSNIFMGYNTLGNPYCSVYVSVTMPGNSSPNMWQVMLYVRWTDSSGNPIIPGGVQNSAGWQPFHMVPNTPNQVSFELDINYPAQGIDGYLQMVAFATTRNLNSVVPFTGDSAVVVQQWTGGTTAGGYNCFLLHVGQPPVNSGPALAIQQGTSMFADPSFQYLGQMIGGLFPTTTDGGWISAGYTQGAGGTAVGAWTVIDASVSNLIKVVNDDGNSDTYCVQFFQTSGHNAGLQQRVQVVAGKTYNPSFFFKSGGTSPNMVAALFWSDILGNQIGSTLTSSLAGVTSSWTQDYPFGSVAAPSSLSSASLPVAFCIMQFYVPPTAGSGSWFKLDDVWMQSVVQHSPVSGQVNSMAPVSQTSGVTALTTTKPSTGALSQVGLIAQLVESSDSITVQKQAVTGAAELLISHATYGTATLQVNSSGTTGLFNLSNPSATHQLAANADGFTNVGTVSTYTGTGVQGGLVTAAPYAGYTSRTSDLGPSGANTRNSGISTGAAPIYQNTTGKLMKVQASVTLNPQSGVIAQASFWTNASNPPSTKVVFKGLNSTGVNYIADIECEVLPSHYYQLVSQVGGSGSFVVNSWYELT